MLFDSKRNLIVAYLKKMAWALVFLFVKTWKNDSKACSVAFETVLGSIRKYRDLLMLRHA
jgi:hypothetical protein